MSQGIHHTNKWMQASVGSLKTFDMVFSNKFLFWFDTFVQTFCVLLAGLLFLVSCAGIKLHSMWRWRWWWRSRFPCCVLLALSWNTAGGGDSIYGVVKYLSSYCTQKWEFWTVLFAEFQCHLNKWELEAKVKWKTKKKQKKIGQKCSFLREIRAQTFYYPIYGVTTTCCVPWQS